MSEETGGNKDWDEEQHPHGRVSKCPGSTKQKIWFRKKATELISELHRSASDCIDYEPCTSLLSGFSGLIEEGYALSWGNCPRGTPGVNGHQFWGHPVGHDEVVGQAEGSTNIHELRLFAFPWSLFFLPPAGTCWSLLKADHSWPLTCKLTWLADLLQTGISCQPLRIDLPCQPLVNLRSKRLDDKTLLCRGAKWSKP